MKKVTVSWKVKKVKDSARISTMYKCQLKNVQF